MRQRRRDGSGFVRVSTAAAPASETLRRLCGFFSASLLAELDDLRRTGRVEGTGMERIGLPFLFRGRSDAVLNTLPTRTKCQAEGRVVHLAEMETTTIKELPAFASAKSILRGWFASRESLRGTNPRFQAE